MILVYLADFYCCMGRWLYLNPDMDFYIRKQIFFVINASDWIFDF